MVKDLTIETDMADAEGTVVVNVSIIIVRSTAYVRTIKERAIVLHKDTKQGQ